MSNRREKSEPNDEGGLVGKPKTFPIVDITAQEIEAGRRGFGIIGVPIPRGPKPSPKK
jgi:hypothetical protein